MEPSGRSQAGYYNVSLAGSGHVAKGMVHCSDWTVNLLNTNLTGDKENHSVLDFIYTFQLLSSLWLVRQGPHVVERAMVAPSMLRFIAACCQNRTTDITAVLYRQTEISCCDAAVPKASVVVLNLTGADAAYSEMKS